MASVTWKNNADGAWATGTNWSTNTVPGAADDVSISTAAAHTITFAGITDSISTLFVSANDLISQSGGTLSILSYGTLSAYTQTGGALVFAGGVSGISGVLTQSAGRITVASGTLQLSGSGDTLSGTIDGAGALDVTTGSVSLSASAVLSVGAFEVSGGQVTLGSSRSYAGAWKQGGGTLSLGASNLTLSGSADFENSVVTGTSTLTLTGQSEVANWYVGGSQTVDNAGTLHQDGALRLGFNTGDTTVFNNQSTGTYVIDASSPIYGVTGSSFDNLGRLDVRGSGTASVQVNFTTSGTVDVEGGTLQLYNATNVLGGAIEGGGKLDLQYGSDLLASGLALTVGTVLVDTGAVVTLGDNLGYAGDWVQAGGTVALAGMTLSLSGPVDLAGGAVTGAGTIALSGATEIRNWFQTGSTVLTNTGSVDQVSNWYLGYNTGDTPSATNAAGGTWRMAGGTVIYSTPGASFANAGTFITGGGGLSTITVNFANLAGGVLNVGSGTLRLDGATNTLGGTITGTGKLDLYSGTFTVQSGLSMQVADIQVDNGATVNVNAALTPTGIWEQTGGAVVIAGGKVLTLNQGSDFNGGSMGGAGALIIAGSNTMSQFYLLGTMSLRNNKYVYQTGDVHIGYNTGDTPVVSNLTFSTWRLFDGANIYGTAGASFRNAGTLAESGSGASFVQVTMVNAGAIIATSGLLQFQGTGSSFGGSLGGAGTIDFYNGTDLFSAGLKINVAQLFIDSNSSVTLGGSLADTHGWNQVGGTLSLGGFVLKLSGAANLDGGLVIGAGTIATSGTTEINNIYFEGSTALANTGVVNQVGSWHLGYNTGDTSVATNAAGGTWRIQNDSYIYGASGSSFSNAGTVISTGSGVGEIQVTYANTGTLTVNDGLLALTASGNTLGGTVNGNGTIDLYQGSDLLSSGLSLSTARWVIDGGAVVTLGGNLSYGHSFGLLNGTVALAGHTLSLSGIADLDGGGTSGAGTIALSGSAEVGNAFHLAGSSVLTNAGALTQTGYWYVGYNSGDTASFDNLAGATLRIEADTTIYGTTGSTFNNAGTVVESGSGTSAINVAVINSGNVLIGSHTMQFNSTVTGSGTISVAAGGTVGLAAAVGSGQHVALGAGATLNLGLPASFAGTISQFVSGDVIGFSGFGFSNTSFSFNATTDVLSVTNGSTSASIKFAGAHTAADFRAFNDQGLFGIVHS